MPSTAIMWGVIAKILNKMADLSPLFKLLYVQPKILLNYKLKCKQRFSTLRLLWKNFRNNKTGYSTK